ncbi:ferritin family protein [bacterium]|nr:ferritin family protein [bacterium]
MKLKTVQEIIDYAIDREKEAVSFYTTCSERTNRDEMQDAFIEMAAEEAKHIDLLKNMDAAVLHETAVERLNDPKMESYIVEKSFHPDMSYQDLLQLAIHREAASVRLYKTLVEQTDDAAVRSILLKLVTEELKHKERLEEFYNTGVLQEN